LLAPADLRERVFALTRPLTLFERELDLDCVECEGDLERELDRVEPAAFPLVLLWLLLRLWRPEFEGISFPPFSIAMGRRTAQDAFKKT
jgi:hypothetical protein